VHVQDAATNLASFYAVPANTHVSSLHYSAWVAFVQLFAVGMILAVASIPGLAFPEASDLGNTLRAGFTQSLSFGR
jgi:hypothetical protein